MGTGEMIDDVLAVKLAEYAERMGKVEVKLDVALSGVSNFKAFTVSQEQANAKATEFFTRYDQNEKNLAATLEDKEKQTAAMHEENKMKLSRLSGRWTVFAIIATALIALSQFFAPEIRSFLRLKPYQTVSTSQQDHASHEAPQDTERVAP